MKYFVLAPVIALLTGAFLESIQHYVTTSRSSDFFDFLANAAGVVASIFFYSFFVTGKKLEKLL